MLIALVPASFVSWSGSMPNINRYSRIDAIPYTVHHIPLPPAAGVGMAGNERQQVASLLDFDLIHLVRLDDPNVGHCVSQRFP